MRTDTFPRAARGTDREPVRPEVEPGNAPAKEPGNHPEAPEAERPPGRREGVVSDPDPCGCGPEIVPEVKGL